MHELTGFEQQLAVAIDDYAGPRRPIDALGIARRAARAGGTRPMRPAILGGRSRATDTRSTLRLAVVAALAATALVAGGLLVGALTQRQSVAPSPAPSLVAPTTPVTSPSTEPSTAANILQGTFSCAEAQAAAARTTTTWVAGPAPAAPAAAESGWIAIWGSDEVPELYLIDPATGAPCLLARFPAYTNPPQQATPQGPLGWVPPRGPLVWSPDGRALAFVVSGENGADLYVWSLAGLSGRLGTDHDNGWPARPSWSPDGSLLAVPERGSFDPTVVPNVRILDRSGAQRSISAGCACYLGSVQWSPSGRTIATTTQTLASGPSRPEVNGIVAGSIDAGRLQDVPILADPASQAVSEQVLGFVDEQSLLLVNPSPQRFTARSITGGADRDLGPTRLTPSMLDQGPLSLAPDRSAWLFNDLSSLGILEIGSGTESILPGTPDGSVAAGWSPNSRQLGYVDMIQGARQGIWVVNRDGTGTRRVTSGSYVLGDDVLGDLLSSFAWQPVWPAR
jgi:hypothetical protein